MTGQDFVKKIRPAGCALFLFMLVMFFVICLKPGNSDPVPGYTPPHDSAYYMQSDETLSELEAELEENVFPYLEGYVKSEVSDGVLAVTITEAKFFTVRSAVLKYYDRELFDFRKG